MCGTETGSAHNPSLVVARLRQIIVSGVWEESQLELPFNVKVVLKDLLSVHNILSGQ